MYIYKNTYTYIYLYICMYIYTYIYRYASRDPRRSTRAGHPASGCARRPDCEETPLGRSRYQTSQFPTELPTHTDRTRRPDCGCLGCKAT